MEQSTADYLIGIEKKITEAIISFPQNNAKLSLDVKSVCDDEEFLLDINRTGIIQLSRCTFQERYNTTIGLIRLDLDKSKPHKNPDGEVIVGPHMHVYRKGYELRWAYLLQNLSMDSCLFKNTDNLVTAFLDFCNYCNIITVPSIQGSM